MGKGSFNPDEYLAKKSEFDPDSYLQKVSQPSKPDTAMKAAAAGLGSGVTLGYAPQIGAAIAPVIDKGIEFFTGMRAPQDTYVQRRDENIANQNALAQSNPLAYGVGDVAGSIATTAAPMGLASRLGLLGKGASASKALVTADQASKLARAGQAAKGIGQAAATGAGIAAITNPGDVEGEISPLQFGQRVDNAKTGALVGGAAAGAVMGVSKLAKGVAGGAKSFAENRAFKALGGLKKATDEANKKGNLKDIGRTLLDEKVVTPFATPKTIAKRLEGKIDDATAAIDGAIEKIQKGMAHVDDLKPDQAEKLKATFFRPLDVAVNLKQQLREDNKGVPDKILKPAFDKIDDWFSEKPDVVGIKDLQEFKKGMNKWLKSSDFYKPSAELGESKLGTLAVRRSYKEGIENQADAVSEMLGGQGGEIKNANKTLGKFLQAEGVVEDKISRDAANRSVSLTDYLSGISGGGVAGIPGALAASAGNKFARTFGNSIMATGSDKLANQLLKIPKFADLAQKNPAQFQMLVNKMIQSPENETAMQRRVKEK